MDLALFDFDGTITERDTFTPFIRAVSHPARFALGCLALSPAIALYKLRLLPGTVMREKVVYFGLRGRRASELYEQGRSYGERVLPRVLRRQALERIDWHKRRGDRVVVVSASLDVYLAPWCVAHGLELVCSELEVNGDLLTGRYRDGDCTGPEKARRVRDQYALASYESVYAYGDSPEDRELLRLAQHRFFRWRELSHSAEPIGL